ncbi:hypothetical protein TSAR_004567 [Trichomalopsis sarcophagae]|uniref:Uncharacterized protein n=1 Tax=Trichomalopsis sarcophagae TaxID=543379 RepID=A0A232FDU6_9HYME|nr:hypothetical protein TSAR_004567 [Trichomalopsis sarcophagae]
MTEKCNGMECEMKIPERSIFTCNFHSVINFAHNEIRPAWKLHKFKCIAASALYCFYIEKYIRRKSDKRTNGPTSANKQWINDISIGRLFAVDIPTDIGIKLIS